MLEGVLDGVVVLDFGQLIAGPVCGMWLADMGATVVKVEPPEGELGRQLGPPWLNGESVTALSGNRNKLGLAIDLKHPAAGAAVRRMIPSTDVLVENFRPGVMERLGFGEAVLRELRPDLIRCSISSYGQTGPWSNRPGVDGIIQAVTGFMSGLASPVGEPGKAPLPLADMTGALFATIAVLGALRRRDREGKGATLDVSLYDSMLMLQHLSLAGYRATGEVASPSGSAAPYAAPNEAFPTRDGWIMVAAYQPGRWTRLCAVIGRPDLADDPRFRTNTDRVRERPALRDALFPIFRTRDTAEWHAALARADILAAPVSDHAAVTRTEQYAASGIEVSVDHPVAGTFRLPGFALGARPAAPRLPPPRVGEHSREVLSRFGFDAAEIETLIAQHVVREPTPA